MKYLLALFVLALTVHAQVPAVANLEHYQEISRDELVIYFIDATNINRLNPRIAFVNTMGVHYQSSPSEKGYKLDNQAYIVTTWRIDCKERTGERIKDVGIWREKPINKTYKNPKPDKPKKERNLFLVIGAVCGDVPSPELKPVSASTKKPYEWTGGNGCNLIGGGKHEKVCCVEHDFSYRTGGGWGVKWKADTDLFKCVWKRNKLLAPFVFVGTQVGGLWAFHWGKRRTLIREAAIPSAGIKP